MSDERGGALVETALIFSVLTLLLFGVVEVSRYVATWHGANTAAREGARYGVAVGPSANSIPRYTDCSEITNAAIRLSGLADVTAADVTVTYDDGTGTPVHDCTSGNPAESAITGGDRVVVTVTRTFQPVTPVAGPFLGAITITATDRRTIFKEAP